MTERVELAGGAVLFVESSRAVPLVAISLCTRTGCALDPDGKEGTLRAALRMLRRGAAGLSATAIEEAIDRLGAELAVDVGPSVATIYGQVIARNAEAFVDLLCSLLSSPTLDERELGRLVRETHAEIVEARDNDRALAERAFRRALFQGHPYARSARGSTASTEAITTRDIRASLDLHLVRDNVVVAIAGDVDRDRAGRLADRLTSALGIGARPDDGLIEPQSRAGRHLVFVDKPERTQAQVLVGSLGSSGHDADHFDLLVGNAAFGGTFTARLMKEIRSKRGWSYGASSRLNLDRKRHSFSIWTFPGATDSAPCIALELELLQRWIDAGITAREHAFTTKYLSRSFAFEVDTASKRVHQSLDEEVLGLPAGYYGDYVTHVGSTSLEAVNGAIARRLSTRDLVIAVVGTANATFEAVKASCGELASATVIPFDDEGA